MKDHTAQGPWLFLLFAFGISWGLFALAKCGGLHFDEPLVFMAIGSLFMLGPAAAAMLTKYIYGGPSWRDMGDTLRGANWKWIGIALLCAMSLAPLTLFFNWFFGNVCGVHGFGITAITNDMMRTTVMARLSEKPDADDAQLQLAMDRFSAIPIPAPILLLLMLVGGAAVGCTVNFLFAMGEELGWRGMLLCTTRSWGFGKHVLFTGVVWGLWHAPLIREGLNYPGHPVAGIAMMCAFTTAMAVPLAWVRIRSGSVWTAGAFHGTINATAGAAALFTRDANTFLGSPVGVSGICALIIVGLVLWRMDRSFPSTFRTT